MPANAKSKLTLLVILGLVLLVAIFVAYPAVQRALARAALIEVANSGRSFKMVMDSFAVDNNGIYPGADSADFYGTGEVTTSNAAFKQLFASGHTPSERIFWVEGAAVCRNTPPDNITTSSGSFDPALTLQAGDNGWSYFGNLINTDNPRLPILVATFLPSTSEDPDTAKLDPTPLHGKAIIIHINNTASVINTDGTAPSGSLPNLGRGDPANSKLQSNTTAILNQPDPHGNPRPLLHPE